MATPLPDLDELTAQELALLDWQVRFRSTSRVKQRAPNETHPKWKTFGICCGRGFGKSFSGSNWLGLEAAQHPNSPWAVVAPTLDDVRETNFEGPAGLLNAIPEILIADYIKKPTSLTLWNGARIRGFAGDSPDRMRGPQHWGAYCDEVASYKYMKDALSNLRFGLRLGPRPRMMWTSTPRPRPELKELIARTDVLYVGTTYENRANLAESFFEEIQQYEGTRLGRQEIHGELINMEEMGIVRRSDWNLWPAAKLLPPFEFIIMSLDTATTEKTVDKKTHDPDYTACSVWGVFDWKGKMNVMLLDAWEERLGLPDLIDRVKRESKYRYGNQDVPLIKPTYLSKPERSGMGGRPIDMILIERQGAGRSLVQMLAQEEVLAHEYNPGRADKLQRLHIVSRIFSHKRVWAVESDKVPGTPKQWAQELITQVCTYAGEGSLPHDDAMDSATQALRVILDKFTGPMTVSRPDPDETLAKAPLIVNPYAQ